MSRTLTRRRFLRLVGAGVAGTALLGGAYVLWGGKEQVSRTIAKVARRVSPGPYRIGAKPLPDAS